MPQAIRKTSDLAVFTQEVPLAAQLPYWDIEDQTMVLADGSLALAYEVKGVCNESWDDERVNQWTLDLRAFLNGLPDGLELEIISQTVPVDIDTLEQHQNLADSKAHSNVLWLTQNRTQKLIAEAEQQSLLQNKLYFVFYARRSDAPQGMAFWKAFFKPNNHFVQIAKNDFEKLKKNLFQNAQSAMLQLEGMGLKSQQLTDRKLLALIYQFFNPKRSLDLPIGKLHTEYRHADFLPSEKALVPALSFPSINEQMVFSDLIAHYDTLYLDGCHHAVVTLKTLPEYTVAAAAQLLKTLDFAHSIHVHVKVPEQSKELSSLQSSRRMAHAMSAPNNGKVSDLESEAKLSSTEELLREIIETGQKIFYLQLTFLLRSEEKEEIEQQVKTILTKFRELSGSEGLKETVGSFKVLQSIFPLGHLKMVRPKRIKTSNLADFLPLQTGFSGSGKPICLFRNRYNSLVNFNPFNPEFPNFNTLVTGSSGAGKSFLNNLVLLQYLGQKPLIYVIDIGGSYKKLCEFLDGQYVELSPPRDAKQSFPTINPFYLASGSNAPSSQKIKFLISLLECQLGEESKLSKLEKSLLEEALLKIYQEKAQPELSDFAKLLKDSKEPALNRFSKLLFPWLKPQSYGLMLDGEQKLNLEAEFVVFDLKGLGQYPDLQSIMILILTDFILGQVESPVNAHRPKQILMDECWEHLKNPAASHFMEYCVRTLRKTGSGITFITQGLEEIAQSPIGSAILSNTAIKFILMQRGSLDPVKQILRLNEQEVGLISSLRQSKGHYSESFLMANEERGVIRMVPTALEYWLATSDAKDNRLLAEIRQKHPELSLRETLQNLSQSHPKGAK